MNIDIIKKPINYIKNMTIGVRIFIDIMLLMIVLLISIWIVQVVFFNTIYKNVKKQEIAEVTNIVEDVINKQAPVEKMIEAGAERDFCIAVFDNTGRQIQSLNGPGGCVVQSFTVNEIKNIFSNINEKTNDELLEYEEADRTYRLVINSSSKDFRIFTKGEKIKSMLYVRKFSDVLNKEYVIMVSAQAAPIESVIRTTRTVLIFLSVFAIIVSIFLSMIISKTISRPIKKINNQAKILATGKYGVEFTKGSYREINELVDTLNYSSSELSNVEKLRRDFISNVSHDLRTPLTLIAGYAEIMRDIPGENSPENAQVIINEANRLGEMVSTILNVSKLQSGADKPNLKKYNITKSVLGIIQNVSDMTKAQGYKIKFIYDEDVYVDADETLINQSFYNLLVNAINHTNQNKNIIVKQEIYNKKVRISVTDNGVGISEEILPYIWERYMKEDKFKEERFKGTGLGLSIVKTFIEAHNGECGVSSKKGVGSTFWFTLNLE